MAAVTKVNNLASLGHAVSAARHQKGLTQEELARQAEVSKSWVSLLEKGRLANPGIGRLFEIFRILGLEMNVHTMPAQGPKAAPELFTYEQMRARPAAQQREGSES